MRLVSVKEALGYSKGEIIPQVRGRITRVDKQSTGGSGEKTWTVQTLVINDGTGEIAVKVWDREPINPSVKGQNVTISSKDGAKGLNGIKADEYRGEKSLKITGTGILEFEGGNGAPASQQAQQTQAPSNTAPASPAPSQAANSAPHNGNGQVNLSGEAKEICRDYYRVMTAVHEMRLAWDKGHPEHKMTPEHFQAACASLFIHCDKRGMI